jgi:carbonic anhydrase
VDVFFEDGRAREHMGLPAVRSPLGEAHIANVGGLLSLTGAGAPRLVQDARLLLTLFSHGTGRVVLTAHSSCGGYHDAVEGEEDAVRARQIEDLVKTAQQLRSAVPEVSVSAFYLDLDSGEVTAIGL